MTPSGHSSVVIDRDPPFLTAKMGLLRQVMQTKVISNHYWDSMTPSRYSSIFRQQGRIGWVILFKINWITGKNTKMISVSQQSNPWELSLVTGRAALYSASPVWVEDNQKESSDHLDCSVESSLLSSPVSSSSPPPPTHPAQARLVPQQPTNIGNTRLVRMCCCCVPHFFSLKDSQ